MNKRIFITSGGTGGHIIPARCLADFLAKENYDVIFFGDIKYKNYIKKDDGFKSKIISSSQLRKKPISLVVAAVKISYGILQMLYFFLTKKPKYLVTFGGYSTFPALIAALLTRTKIIIHEQNSHLGKVNRLFAKFANKIALSFLETSGVPTKMRSKTIFTGNPVRQEILELNKISYKLPIIEEKKSIELPQENRMGYDVLLASDFHKKIEESPIQNLFNILIIGGSGGAKIFSEILPKAFFNLSENVKEHIRITQQCRAELARDTFLQYQNFNINVTVDSFFENMPELIAESHLVIARSGSSSIFEFCAAKKPMILIPFAASADNHQEKNAKYLENQGAAIVISESEFTINKINSILKNLLDNSQILEKMSQNAAECAVLDATQNLARLVK